MSPSCAKGPRRWKALSFAAVLVASILVAAPALGSYGLLAVFGHTGQGPGRIGPHAPAIAVDPDGRVYVADLKDGRIEAFTNAGAPDGGWGGFHDLSGVAAAPDGTLVVSSSTGVERFAFDGTWLDSVAALSGAGGVGVGPDGTVYIADPQGGRVVIPGRVGLGGLQTPVAVAVGPDASVYVADRGDGRIHVFGPTGAPIRTWDAGDPVGVAVAPDNTVFVATDTGNRVLHTRADGDLIETLGGVNGPHGVATDCRGRAYVVDNSALRVHVFGDEGDPPPCPEEVPAPPPAPAQQVAGAVASEPEPVLGVSARASAVTGEVKVGKGKNLRKLGKRELIPIGSTVDATGGHVKLEFETAPGGDRTKYGHLMDGEFYDGAFSIEQSTKTSLVDLKLIEDDVPDAGTSKARASASKKLRVWGKARGRFRTVGRNGAATLRGTVWLTEERPDGTLFRVREGIVEVREFATGERHILEAGESFLAKPACVSRRAFRIRLRTPRYESIRRVVVRINGRRVKVRAGTRLTAPIDLRGRPAGVVNVRIRLVTRSGRVIEGLRRYRTCRKTPVHPGRPPEL
jgi:DNA-binding beta-propeller fold protein YncE